MSFWNDYLRRKLTLRDHSDSTRLDERAGVHSVIRTEREEDQTQGTASGFSYLEGGFFVQGGKEKEEGKSWGGSFFAAGGEISKEGFLPYRDSSQRLDDRYKSISVSGQRHFACKSSASITTIGGGGVKSILTGKITANNLGALLPSGQPGILLAGTEEKSQHLNFFGAWDGVLASDDKELKRSTLMADIVGGKVNSSRIGALHSILRVSPSWDGRCSPALFLAQRDEEKDLGGMFYSHGRGGSTGPVIGYLGTDFFGPISGGTDGGDKHNIGLNPDGHSCNQGHIDGLAPIFLDGRRDAPIDFDDDDYELDQDWGVLSKVYCRYNPEVFHQSFANGAVEGKFSFQGRTTWFVLPPKRKPKKPDPKKPKVPNPPLVPGGNLPPRRPDDVFRFPGGFVTPRTGEEVDLNPKLSEPIIVKPLPTGPDPTLFNPLDNPHRPALKDFSDFEQDNLPRQDRSNRTGLCLYNFSWLEAVWPSHMGQPTPIGLPDRDLRNVGAPPRDLIEEIYTKRPFSYREEAYGSLLDDGSWEYNQFPDADDGHYKTGTTARGGKHFMPPEMSLDQVLNDTIDSDLLSEIYHSYQPDKARIAWATPLLTGDRRGTVKNGYSTGLVDGALCTDEHDNDGNRSTVMCLDDNVLNMMGAGADLQINGVSVSGGASGYTKYGSIVSDGIFAATIETVIGSANIPANAMTVGRRFRIRAEGFASNNSPSLVSREFRFRVGGLAGQLLTDVVGLPFQVGVTDGGWYLEQEFVVRSTGLAGDLKPGNPSSWFKTSIATTLNCSKTEADRTVSIDTTAAQDVVITHKQSTTVAAAQVTITNFVVEAI